MIYAEERQNKIMELLSEKGRIDTPELMTLLQTSRETIRRDLNKLSKDGRIVKTHGGAILPDSTQSGMDYPLSTREKSHKQEKLELCVFAAQHIGEMETIFLDNSSTVAGLIQYLPRQNHMNIIVHSVPLLLRLSQIGNPNWNVISLGGSLVYSTMSTSRYLTLEAFQNFRPSKAFISCHSINSAFIATDSFLDDIELKRLALHLSSETYLLADASKLNSSGVMKIADAADFHHIVTNENADRGFVSQMNANGCKVHLASAFH